MNIITHFLVGYFVLAPVYIVLASHSLRYNVSQSKVSERAIEQFLDNIRFPLRSFFTEQSGYNLFTTDSKTVVSHFLLTVPPQTPAIQKRIGWGIMCVVFIVGIGIGMTKQTEAMWIVEHILLVIAHSISLYWAWNFGSKLTRMEAELHQ